MVKDAEKYKEEDEKMRKKVEAKNGLESYIFHIRNSMKEEKLKDKFSDEEKRKVENIVDST